MIEKILQEYSDASPEFDLAILAEYLNRYPEYAERLRAYASIWLMSRRATPEEIADEEVPMQEMLTIQSRLLTRLHNLKLEQELTNKRIETNGTS